MTKQTATAAPAVIHDQAPAEALPIPGQSVGEIMLNPAMLQQIDAIAARMAQSKVTIPKHLVGSPGDCYAVVMQAVQWRMNPFSVAQKTHIVNGALGYEAQLVNAVVCNSGLIEGGFRYEYRDDPLACRVGARLKGDDAITWGEWLEQRSVQTQNSPLWKTNPRQQLGYLQVKNWARAYTPGAILGVYTPDELQTMPQERDITPQDPAPEPSTRTSAVKARLRQAVDQKPEEPEDALPPADGKFVAQYMDAIRAAGDESTLEAVGQRIHAFLALEGGDKYRAELMGTYKARLVALRSEAEPQEQLDMGADE
jgi:hypothetical protein